MQKLAKNRKGLSQVITTLIILVVAVLLAGVVTYYATNIVMTRTTQEEVRIRKPHIWVQEGDNAYAAFMVQNLGGRDVLVDKIAVRGVDCSWGGDEVIDIADGGAPYPTVANGIDFTKTPIAPGSIKITVIIDGSKVEITDTPGIYPDGELVNAAVLTVPGAIDYFTGIWSMTFTAGNEPDAGSSITASYAVEGAINVQYYLVQSGDDVSGDFELKETAGVVYAQIGEVPLAQADWKNTISDMPLKSSGTMLFFITNPTNIALNDVGTTISLTVFTTNAQWVIETNVQAAVIELVP